MSDLCLECGICCNGFLYGTALLRDGEEKTLIDAGVRVERRSDKLVLLQPCTGYRDNKCGVYDIRPQVCRNYQCGLLQNVHAGTTGIDEAKQIVAKTRSLAFTLRDRTQTLSKDSELPLQEKLGLARDTLALGTLIQQWFMKAPPPPGADAPAAPASAV